MFGEIRRRECIAVATGGSPNGAKFMALKFVYLTIALRKKLEEKAPQFLLSIKTVQMFALLKLNKRQILRGGAKCGGATTSRNYRYRLTLLLCGLSCASIFMVLSYSSGETRKKEAEEKDPLLLREEESNWTEVQSERLRVLQLGCEKLRQQPRPRRQRDLPAGYVFDPESGLAYCHVPKAASTWWLKVFAQKLHPNGLDDEEEDKGESDNDDEKDGRLHSVMLRNVSSSSSLPSDAFRFVFVRHPLDRLVSAYVNKVVRNRSEKVVNNLARFVRRKSSSAKEATMEINFPRFVDFVVEELDRDMVSFGTLHWLPYHRLCDMCTTGLSMIGKLETMEEDVQYLVGKFPSLRQIVRETKKENSGGSKRHDVYRKYLSQLSDVARSNLCRIYEQDFKLFGYSCDYQ